MFAAEAHGNRDGHDKRVVNDDESPIIPPKPSTIQKTPARQSAGDDEHRRQREERPHDAGDQRLAIAGGEIACRRAEPQARELLIGIAFCAEADAEDVLPLHIIAETGLGGVVDAGEAEQ